LTAAASLFPGKKRRLEAFTDVKIRDSETVHFDSIQMKHASLFYANKAENHSGDVLHSVGGRPTYHS